MPGKCAHRLIALLTVAAIVNAAHGPARAFEIRIPNPLGLLTERPGENSYKSTPIYQRFVKPYVSNAAAYDKMMNDYAQNKTVSEKLEVALLIKLGLVRYKPEWLNEEAWKKIDIYYPGIRDNKTERDQALIRLAGLSGNEAAGSPHPAQNSLTPRYAQGALPVVVLTLAVMETLAAVSVFGMGKRRFYKFLTPPAQRLYMSKEDDVCSKLGGCTQNAAPAPGSGAGGGVNCARVISECRERCTRIYAGEEGGRLPGVGHDMFGRLRRCIRECAIARGCEM